MHLTAVRIRKVNTHARSYLGCISFLQDSCAAEPQLLRWLKVMSLEGTDDTSARSLTPQEPLSEETVRAIADCVVQQLRSSTQDGDSSRAVELVPSATAPQGTSGGELSLWR